MQATFFCSKTLIKKNIKGKMNETYQRGDVDLFKDSPLDENGHNATVGQHFALSFLLSLI